MKRILAVVMAMAMLLSMTITSFAAAAPKATAAPKKPVATPAPVFKFYNHYYYQSEPGNYLNLMIVKEGKKVTLARADYTQELAYTKITQGKTVTKGTTVWIFTGACVLVTYNAETGEEIRSKPWNTTVTITFKNAETIVGVFLPKHGDAKGENFKGVMGLAQGGY